MIKKIRVDQLRPGMFIHDLNCGWLDHPFLSNSFHVGDLASVEKIVRHGIRELYIDTARGDDVHNAPTQHEIEAALDEQFEHIAQAAAAPPAHVPLRTEALRARRLRGEANRIVLNLMHDVRLGRQIEIEHAEPMVSNIVDSIFANRDALLPILRLKRHDEYTFQHCVSVAALLAAFARHLGLSREIARELGLGGLLHDIGKARIAENILNKPGKLDDKEFARMRCHVDEGLEVLRNSKRISDIALQVTAEHHERCDGSGYPQAMDKNALSLYGKMAAIVDVYDAITSNRVYHKGIPPTLALRKLLEWSNHHFDAALVQSFIRAVGIYPSGSLVALNNDCLAVVTEQHEDDLLKPMLCVFFNTSRRAYIEPYMLDLSAQDSIKITAYENPETWQIDPYRWLQA
ncbi:HD-GYP domain-containing protein [Azonexus sp.]|uniref:HD-GYP domain-containing protein n=1 Tax=Azonexus sp. TaxID=1872668 RepID=UPI0039E2B92A